MRIALIIHSSNFKASIGGVERYIRSQVDLMLSNSIIPITIFSIRKKFGPIGFDYHGVMIGKTFKGVFTINDIVDILSEFIKSKQEKVSVDVYVHHLMNVNIDHVMELIRCIDYNSISIFLHDFYTVCLQHNLMRNDEKYCGNSLVNYEKCKGCKYYQKSKKHRLTMAVFLNKIDKKRLTIVAPSILVFQLWGDAYPDFKDNIIIREHLVEEGEFCGNNEYIDDKEKIRVAFLGTQTRNKGWNKWVQVSNFLLERNPMIDFYYFGIIDDTRSGIKNIFVSTAQEGQNAMIKALRDNHIHVAVLFSQCPETYSYMYQEARASNCYIITNKDSGNIACQVDINDNGIVINNEEKDLLSLLDNSIELRKAINLYRAKKITTPNEFKENIWMFNDNRAKCDMFPEKAINEFAQNIRKGIINRIVDLLYRSKYKSLCK